MRKLISLFLVLAMILSLSVTAFADEAETANKATANKDSEYKASIDVNGKYISELKSDEIISVDVAWQDMNFIYYASQQGTWDPGEHKYIGDTNATWNKTTSDITVTNHSNLEVTANLSYTQSVTSVTGKLSKTVLTMESAAQEKYMGENAKQAPTAKSTFTLDSTSYLNDQSGTNLGTITVSVAKSNAENTDDAENGNDDSEWTAVSTFAALKEALENGQNAKLLNDITENDGEINSTVSFKLDLNGKKLTLKELWCCGGSGTTVSIFNGTIASTGQEAVDAGSELLTIESCTLIGNNYFALLLSPGNAVVKNTKLEGGVYLGGMANLTATENVEITQYATEKAWSGICLYHNLDASAKFSFEPNALFSTRCNGIVTNNGDGTWTVS